MLRKCPTTMRTWCQLPDSQTFNASALAVWSLALHTNVSINCEYAFLTHPTAWHAPSSSPSRSCKRSKFFPAALCARASLSSDLSSLHVASADYFVMADSLAHLQDDVAAYPPCSLGSVFNSSWQAPPAPPPSRVSADAPTPPLSQSAAFAAASPLSASLSAAASSSLVVPTAPVRRVHCLHRLRSSESNGDSDYDDDPDLFCQCYHDDDDGDIYSSGSDADDDAHDSRDGDDNAGAGPVQRQPKRRRTRTPASHAQRVYDNHYDHSLSATAVQHAITTHCCDEECIMRCFTVHELSLIHI